MTTHPKGLWSISKWARLRSYTKPEDVTMLPLGRDEDTLPTATSYKEKVALLSERFFPVPLADLGDITNRIFGDDSSQQRFTLNRDVDTGEVMDILRNTSV